MTVGSRVLGGRYRLGSVLGQGGMAVVYRAEDLTLGRTVAVKVLREALGTEHGVPGAVPARGPRRRKLNHPNIIAVYDVGQDGPSNYIVMEYVEGEDLRELIREQGALPPEQVVDIGCQIAAALEYAHRKGLVHRDIKSQNVLVTPEGKVKVARLRDRGGCSARARSPRPGMVIGSVHYMSPEQAEGRPTTPASDVYSLGVVLYEMATGELPFTAESPIAVARLQLEATPTPPHVVNPRLPRRSPTRSWPAWRRTRPVGRHRQRWSLPRCAASVPWRATGRGVPAAGPGPARNRGANAASPANGRPRRGAAIPAARPVRMRRRTSCSRRARHPAIPAAPPRRARSGDRVPRRTSRCLRSTVYGIGWAWRARRTPAARAQRPRRSLPPSRPRPPPKPTTAPAAPTAAASRLTRRSRALPPAAPTATTVPATPSAAARPPPTAARPRHVRRPSAMCSASPRPRRPS